MQLSPDYVSSIIGAGDVSAEDAARVIRLAYLVAELDLDADVDESETLQSVTESLSRYHPEEAEPIPLDALPVDAEERRALRRSLVDELQSQQARELAYATAYLMVAANAQLDPLEGDYLEELREELGIDSERAATLALMSARSATPGLDEALAEPDSSARR